MGVVYGFLVVSIEFFFLAILMVLIIIIENIYSIYLVIACGIFLFLGVAALVISLSDIDMKFVINSEECKIESRKGILLSAETQSIRRIVILVTPRGGKQYIIIDCEKYPFLIPQDFIYLKLLCTRYTLRRLKKIRKYCPDCRIDTEALRPWVK